MRTLRPVGVSNGLIVRIAIVERPRGVALRSHRRVVRNCKPRPAAFKSASAVRAWNAEHVASDVRSEPKLLRVGIICCVTEVVVEDEGRSKYVSYSRRYVPCSSISRSGDRSGAVERNSQQLAEHRSAL